MEVGRGSTGTRRIRSDCRFRGRPTPALTSLNPAWHPTPDMRCDVVLQQRRNADHRSRCGRAVFRRVRCAKSPLWRHYATDRARHGRDRAVARRAGQRGRSRAAACSILEVRGCPSLFAVLARHCRSTLERLPFLGPRRRSFLARRPTVVIVDRVTRTVALRRCADAGWAGSRRFAAQAWRRLREGGAFLCRGECPPPLRGARNCIFYHRRPAPPNEGWGAFP